MEKYLIGYQQSIFIHVEKFVITYISNVVCFQDFLFILIVYEYILVYYINIQLYKNLSVQFRVIKNMEIEWNKK